jgi:DNA gyrase subunit B
MQNQEPYAHDWKSHIRKRPAMYIGNLRLNGFTQLLENLFQDILKNCAGNQTFDIEFYPQNRLIIKITGIDTQQFILELEKLKKTDETIINIGLAVLISLSSDIAIAVNYLSDLILLNGQKGDFEITTSISHTHKDSIKIEFIPDKDILKELELVYEHTNSFLRQFAFLNPDLKIISTDKTTGELQRNIFCYPTGVFKQLDYFVSKESYGTNSMLVKIDAKINKYSYKIGISYSTFWPDKSCIKTYAGNVETFLGGSFNDGILEGLLLSIKEIAQKQHVEIIINRKLLKEQLIIVAAVTGDEFIFHGSIKRKLGMPGLKKDVKHLVYERLTEYFDSNPEATKKILHKFKRWE